MLTVLCSWTLSPFGLEWIQAIEGFSPLAEDRAGQPSSEDPPSHPEFEICSADLTTKTNQSLKVLSRVVAIPMALENVQVPKISLDVAMVGPFLFCNRSLYSSGLYRSLGFRVPPACLDFSTQEFKLFWFEELEAF